MSEDPNPPARLVGGTPKRPRDTNQLAKAIVDIATGQELDAIETASPARRAAGRKGGKARASSLTSERRSEIAVTAAAARWEK